MPPSWGWEIKAQPHALHLIQITRILYTKSGYMSCIIREVIEVEWTWTWAWTGRLASTWTSPGNLLSPVWRNVWNLVWRLSHNAGFPAASQGTALTVAHFRAITFLCPPPMHPSFLHWKWRQLILPKHWKWYTTPHGITSPEDGSIRRHCCVFHPVTCLICSGGGQFAQIWKGWGQRHSLVMS